MLFTSPKRSAKLSRTVFALALIAISTASLALTTAAASAQSGGLPAPETTLSADGRTATDGIHTLTVAKVTGVYETGEAITVHGSGYNEEKGVYIALCAIPAKNAIPSPCGGGIDLGGEGGSSFWISSNPPAYGQGLAIPYGPGGSFSVSLDVSPLINAQTDCRVIACAVITRNDHTRASDRSQDIFVPVTFGPAPSITPVPTAAPLTPAPEPTAPPATNAPGATDAPAPSVTPATPTPSPGAATPSPTAIPAPTSLLSSDGRTATASGRTLTVSVAKNLDSSGEAVTVRGANFDPAKGVYVALCAIPGASQPPKRCTSGSAGVSAWISSNPPDYGKDLAQPYAAGGEFEVTLTVRPIIDGETDCRIVKCAIFTRNDDTNPDDRSQDLFVPVTFSKGAIATNQAKPAEDPQVLSVSTDGGSDGGGSSSWLLWGIVALAVGLAAAGGAFAFWRKTHALTLSVLTILLLTACSTVNSQEDGPTGTPEPAETGIHIIDEQVYPTLPVTVTSEDGREVTVTDVSRIVPLWGSIAEVVFGLGLGDNVVGRDISATFPEADTLPLITRAHDVSAESVLSLRPTVVLASEDTGPAEALQHIRNVGIPVIQFKAPSSIDDIVPRIQAIAAALGVPGAGDILIRDVAAELDAVQAEIPVDTAPPRVAFLYMRGQAGVYLIAGPGSGADSMIQAAGGVDAGTAIGLDQPFTPITSEALVNAAPEVILMTTTGLESVGGIDGLVDIPGIGQTPAGRDRRVVTIEDGLLYSFGPRTPYTLRTLIADIFGPAPGAS